MSKSSHVRVLSVFGVWLGLLTGCGGNPEVSDPSDNGGSSSGGTGGTGTGGNQLDIPMGGESSGGGDGDPGTAICGNKALEPGEVCDDGNTADADGCSADCAEVDLDYDCSAIGEGCVQVVICGNGVLEGAELCDDGNTDPGDGCVADCKAIEDGWACVRPNAPCVAVSVCGNGVRERGEQCDDQVNMSPMAGDGCDALCQLEAGYDCPPGQACVQRVCGNGVRTPDEACDDDNMADGDGCSTACVVESGWRCNANGCLPICGDGFVRTPEQCDDSDRDSGDGCSAACTEEPFFNCTGQPSACVSSISCGNSVVEPGEICDPPGSNGCKAGCKSFTPDVAVTAVCGNSVIESNETCDPPNNNQGCSSACAVQVGWTCPQAGVCFRNPFCGDSVVQAGEECDPPKANQGCSAACKEEAGWTCVGLGPSTCVRPVCGNGTVEPGEQCDDGNNTNAGDGCHPCSLTTGWACPEQGKPCIPRCGDGLKRGIEECDDGDIDSGDGCNAGCKVEPGFACPAQGNCARAVCGNNVVEGGEGCDDNNKIAGDGCGPTCQPEPTVSVGPNPVVNVFCGDGLKTGTEDCDDGNVDPGDGCDELCEVELPGWTCSGQTTLPTSLDMRVTYRDFKSANALTAGGHPDFQYNTFSQVRGITGDACTSANAGSCGRLDTAGKPPLVRTGQQDSATGYSHGTGIMNADTFGLWFRSTNPANTVGYNGAIQITPFTRTLTLVQQGAATSEVYSFPTAAASSANFFPLGENEGFGNIGDEVALCDSGNSVRNQVNGCHGCDGTCRARNFGFTSELRYFFQYKGGERLTFTGDDDVWVYINGKLAVDLGGLHSELSGQVVLGDDGNGVAGNDSGCSAHGVGFGSLPNPTTCYSAVEQADNQDARFGLTKGGVYEIVLFHAERHSNASNFRLTLAGFLAPRSFCETVCGDGIVVGDEYCDDGANNSNTIAGRCNTSCTARSFCGDAVKQTGEFCDNGSNTDLYRTVSTPVSACAPGCNALASCGDALLQAGFEDCDKGGANNDASYGPTSCKTDCKLGGYCGDSTKNGTEVCDLGANNGKTYGVNSCGYDCKLGARCGDSIRNGPEECDDGSTNGTAGSNCSATCTIKPYCGDGVTNGAEKCDYGQFASATAYGGCTNQCEFGPLCGDGTPDDPYEECDDGTVLNTGGYDGCTNKCDFGPRCGDAVLQSASGEVCDNGFNDDIYKENATSCGPLCMPPAYCGDGTVQPGFELCDAGNANSDDTYEGCSVTCEWGPFCGDATIDTAGGEKCDDGLDNVPYALQPGGCSYECASAPYCGDGVRNGPEQCDLPDGNSGDYGTCNADCTLAERCGDSVRQATEECDDGPSGSPDCTLACKRRQVAK